VVPATVDRRSRPPHPCLELQRALEHARRRHELRRLWSEACRLELARFEAVARRLRLGNRIAARERREPYDGAPLLAAREVHRELLASEQVLDRLPAGLDAEHEHLAERPI